MPLTRSHHSAVSFKFSFSTQQFFFASPLKTVWDSSVKYHIARKRVCKWYVKKRPYTLHTCVCLYYVWAPWFLRPFEMIFASPFS